jgi:hypothetical protein
VSTFVIPTGGHESDGTLEWDSTTLVVVEVTADGRHGLVPDRSVPGPGIESKRKDAARFAA